MPSVEHLQQKYQNNRAENSHQPTRLREKLMRRFKSAGYAALVQCGCPTYTGPLSSRDTHRCVLGPTMSGPPHITRHPPRHPRWEASVFVCLLWRICVICGFDFGVPYGSRTRVAAVKKKRTTVIQRNFAAWIALYPI